MARSREERPDHEAWWSPFADEREARERKARKLIDQIYRLYRAASRIFGREWSTAKLAQCVDFDLTPERWADLAKRAGVRVPSFKTKALISHMFRERVRRERTRQP